jgi:hypothetical protein
MARFGRCRGRSRKSHGVLSPRQPFGDCWAFPNATNAQSTDLQSSAAPCAAESSAPRPPDYTVENWFPGTIRAPPKSAVELVICGSSIPDAGPTRSGRDAGEVGPVVHPDDEASPWREDFGDVCVRDGSSSPSPLEETARGYAAAPTRRCEATSGCRECCDWFLVCCSGLLLAVTPAPCTAVPETTHDTVGGSYMSACHARRSVRGVTSPRLAAGGLTGDGGAGLPCVLWTVASSVPGAQADSLFARAQAESARASVLTRTGRESADRLRSNCG